MFCISRPGGKLDGTAELIGSNPKVFRKVFGAQMNSIPPSNSLASPSASRRYFVSELSLDRSPDLIGRELFLLGWVFRLRALAKTTFVVLKDATGTLQCVASSEQLKGVSLKLDDVVRVRGKLRAEPRSKTGFEFDISSLEVVNPSAHNLPFNASGDLKDVGLDVQLEHRPLSLRNERNALIFRVQAAILHHFREFLRSKHFTEIVTSKFVASGTEGGTNLFEVKYFDRVAYLAQSPQFYKEHGVAAFERVFETGHVYRAEPHATSRHLTEYYSLDLEMGFVNGPEEIIALERALLTHIFERLNASFPEMQTLLGLNALPSMESVPTWEFHECTAKLEKHFGRTDCVDDLDPEAERQLCKLAEAECGVPAVFVLGFPMAARPFYTHPRDAQRGSAASFDLLFRGLEITTGGQRLHTRAALEASLWARGIEPSNFENHLRMFDLGMPPHGGLALGLERLTAQILGLGNVREATMYPRDRNRISP